MAGFECQAFKSPVLPFACLLPIRNTHRLLRPLKLSSQESNYKDISPQPVQPVHSPHPTHPSTKAHFEEKWETELSTLTLGIILRWIYSEFLDRQGLTLQ